jgi:hypothetical protein
MLKFMNQDGKLVNVMPATEYPVSTDAVSTFIHDNVRHIEYAYYAEDSSKSWHYEVITRALFNLKTLGLPKTYVFLGEEARKIALAYFTYPVKIK